MTMRIAQPHAPRARRLGFVLMLSALSALVAAGCSQNSGIAVRNMTGEAVSVELIGIDRDGGSSVYSTARVAPGGEYTSSMAAPAVGQSTRARFSLERASSASAEPAVEDNWVILGLPGIEARSRSIDRYVLDRAPNGRLRATRELSRATK
jgi:hypothetical protein